MKLKSLVCIAIISSFVISHSVGTGWTPGSVESAKAASEFIKKISKEGPFHEGVPMRDYLIQDVDFDGQYEVLEVKSEIEEKSPGFLNVELESFLNWTDVYRFDGKSFKKDTGSVKWFLHKKKSEYELALKHFNNPSNLSSDSKNLIKNNAQLKKILEQYIDQITRLLK